MNAKPFETVLLSFLFVINISGIGFLTAIVIKAIEFYIKSPDATGYSNLVKIKLLAPQYVPDYLLTAVLFAVVALIIIYVWKQNRALKNLIFGD